MTSNVFQDKRFEVLDFLYFSISESLVDPSCLVETEGCRIPTIRRESAAHSLYKYHSFEGKNYREKKYVSL